MRGFSIRIEDNKVDSNKVDRWEQYTLITPTGEHILASMTYDELGWSGMDAVRDAITIFAEAMKIRMFIQESEEE